MVKECFDDVIQQQRQQGNAAEMLRTFPQGYIACQFSAEFGNDKTLDQLAHGLGRVCTETGLGVVLFRAGAAPWHDRLEPYERLKRRLPEDSVRLFQSLHLWDVCALIAASRAFCGSSLHGSIVAIAYGLPHVSLVPPQRFSHPGKVAAYLETWEPEGRARCFDTDDIGSELARALAQPGRQQESLSQELAMRYRARQQQWATMACESSRS